jgi:hypothetical protein
VADRDVRRRPKLPSHRGALVIDTVRGRIRVRRWPRRATPQQRRASAPWSKWLRIQTALYNLLPAEFKAQLQEQARGWPWMPRDLWIAAQRGTLWLLETADGITIYPLQFMEKVSQALDALGQSAGDLLARGPTLWQRVPIGTPGQVLTVQGTPPMPVWADLPPPPAPVATLFHPPGAWHPAIGGPSLVYPITGWGAWRFRDGAADHVTATFPINPEHAPYAVALSFFVIATGTHQFRVTFRYAFGTPGSTLPVGTTDDRTVQVPGSARLTTITWRTDLTPPTGALLLSLVVGRDGVHSTDTSTADLYFIGAIISPA